MDVTKVEDVVIKGGAAIGAALTVWKLGKGIWSVCKAYYQLPESLKVIQEQVQKNGEQIAKIESEMRTNGGSSIRDALNRIEEELFLRKQKIFLGLDAAGDVGIFETDSHGECTWISAGYTKMTGKNLEECSGQNWVYVIYEDDRSKVVEQWKTAVSDKRIFEETYRLQKDGIPFLVKCRAFPIFKKDHSVAGYLGVLKIIKSQSNDTGFIGSGFKD